MKITQEQINDLKKGKNEHVEFKLKFSSQHIAKDICAFANTQGGRLYLGVNDDGTILGLTQEECDKYSKYLHDIASKINAVINAQICYEGNKRMVTSNYFSLTIK